MRLALASLLQRLPLERRAPLAARGEDASDHNLPLLVWYGLIPLAERDPLALAGVAAACEFPQTLMHPNQVLLPAGG